MDNNQMKQTKFDSMVTNQTMQLIKAVIPYINNPIGKYIGTFIKFRELQNAINMNSNLSLTAMNTDKHQGMGDMLEDIMDFLGDDTRETFESLKGMMEMMEMMNGMDMNEDMMNAFMGSAFGGDKEPDFNSEDEPFYSQNDEPAYDENDDVTASQMDYEKGFDDYEQQQMDG